MRNLLKFGISLGVFFLISNVSYALVKPNPQNGYHGGAPFSVRFFSQDQAHSVKIKYRKSNEANYMGNLECSGWSWDQLWVTGYVYNNSNPPEVTSTTEPTEFRVIDCDSSNNRLGGIQNFKYHIDPYAPPTASPDGGLVLSNQKVTLLSNNEASHISFNKIIGDSLSIPLNVPTCDSENYSTKISLGMPFTVMKAVACYPQVSFSGEIDYISSPVATFKYTVADSAIPTLISDVDTVVSGFPVELKPIFVGETGEIDNGVGAVTSGGSYSVSPTETTTYTLTVTNGTDVKTATKTITVNPVQTDNPIIADFSISVTQGIVSGYKKIFASYKITGAETGSKLKLFVHKDSALGEIIYSGTIISTSANQILSGQYQGGNLAAFELNLPASVSYVFNAKLYPPSSDTDMLTERSDTVVISGDTVVVTPTSYEELIPSCIEDPEKGEYCLLEQIPGFPEKIDNTNFTLGKYLNRLYQLGIAIAGVLGVVMIVVSGVMYMTTDSFQGKSEGKKLLMNAIGGVVLALLSWIILNTLNPSILNFNLEVPKTEIAAGDWGDLVHFTAQQYENITGKPLPTDAEVIKWAKDAATSAQVDECVPLTLMAMESHGDPRAVGRDENVTKNGGTKSNKAYINTTETYNGTSKPAGTYIKNESTLDDTKDHLGLDWRFSKGIGLLQVTFFPSSYANSDYITNPPGPSGKTVLPLKRGSYLPKDLLDAQTNLEVGISIWKNMKNACGGDIQKGFNAYNHGSGNNGCNLTDDYGKVAKKTYDNCIKEKL